MELISFNSKNLCFIRLDTAWSSCADSEKKETDCRNLLISEYQLTKLEEEYQIIKREVEDNNKQIDLTIALSHHPINWLEASEERKCDSSFLSNDGLNVDILLCGHVHDFSLIHYFNHQHSILTLVTGFAGGTLKDNVEHRYSFIWIKFSE